MSHRRPRCSRTSSGELFGVDTVDSRRSSSVDASDIGMVIWCDQATDVAVQIISFHLTAGVVPRSSDAG